MTKTEEMRQKLDLILKKTIIGINDKYSASMYGDNVDSVFTRALNNISYPNGLLTNEYLAKCIYDAMVEALYSFTGDKVALTSFFRKWYVNICNYLEVQYTEIEAVAVETNVNWLQYFQKEHSIEEAMSLTGLSKREIQRQIKKVCAIHLENRKYRIPQTKHEINLQLNLAEVGELLYILSLAYNFAGDINNSPVSRPIVENVSLDVWKSITDEYARPTIKDYFADRGEGVAEFLAFLDAKVEEHNLGFRAQLDYWKAAKESKIPSKEMLIMAEKDRKLLNIVYYDQTGLQRQLVGLRFFGFDEDNKQNILVAHVDENWGYDLPDEHFIISLKDVIEITTE